jgi:hypothetical protein
MSSLCADHVMLVHSIDSFFVLLLEIGKGDEDVGVSVLTRSRYKASR